jgi:hypothetical protein
MPGGELKKGHISRPYKLDTYIVTDAELSGFDTTIVCFIADG